MKQLFFVLTIAFGLMSFAPSNETMSNMSMDMETKVEYKKVGDCDYYTRTCFYQGGVLLGCTEWTCVIVLDEIVINA